MAGANPVPFGSDNVAMTGSWVKWVAPNQVNAIQFQNRSEVATSYSFFADGRNHITLRSKYSQILGSFNTNNQSIWLKASAGTIIEILFIRLP